MFPHPFQFMIGAAIGSEWERADREQHVQNVEHHANRLEHRVQSTLDDYNRLGDAFLQLQKYAKSIEGARDELQHELSMVIDQFMEFSAEVKELTLDAQGFKKNIENWVQKNSKKLEAYAKMKDLLTKLASHQEVFTPEFVTKYGEKLAKFVEQLPD